MRILAVTILAGLFASGGLAAEFDGEVSLGGVIVDQIGNQGVYRPTYNVYEGVALSFDKLRYTTESGLRFSGFARNITMNNRDIMLGVAKSSRFDMRFRNEQYRRVYTFDGDEFTRRRISAADIWYQPLDFLRLFGTLSYGERAGTARSVFQPLGFSRLGAVDFSNLTGRVGIRLFNRRDFLEAEFRANSYDDKLRSQFDREGRRYRAAFRVAVPRYSDFTVHGGGMRYEQSIEELADSITANVFWGGITYLNERGYRVAYSAVFDRSRHTGDFSSTDNSINAITVGRTWRGKANLNIGISHSHNDDVLDELQGLGWFASGWYRISSGLSARAAYGNEENEIEAGSTLLGNESRERWSVSTTYNRNKVRGGIIYERREHRYEDILSESDFDRAGIELGVGILSHFDVDASYDFREGNHENPESSFDFREHQLSGDVRTDIVKPFEFGLGGSYLRAKRDVDMEMFTVRAEAVFTFLSAYRAEVRYGAHNFDNFADTSAVYDEYYTANIIELRLIKAF